VAAFYADNDVSVHVATELIALGHTAATARSLGLTRADDATQLLTAAQQHWLLITCNGTDFLLLHLAWRLWSQAWAVQPVPLHAGILWIPQQRWLAPTAAQEIDAFVRAGLQVANTLYQWTPSGGWVQRV